MKRDYEIAVDLLTNGKVSHDFVITHRYGLEEYEGAINSAFDKYGSKCLRAVFMHAS